MEESNFYFLDQSGFDVEPTADFELSDPLLELEDYGVKFSDEPEKIISEDFMKERISTDNIMELVSRNEKIYEFLNNVDLDEESPIFKKKKSVGNYCDILRKELVENVQEGDLKVDYYFPYSDLPDKPIQDRSGSMSYNQVSDFLEKISSIDDVNYSFESERSQSRYIALHTILNNLKKVDMTSIMNIKNDFVLEHKNRARKDNKPLGSVDLNYSWHCMSKLFDKWVEEGHKSSTSEFIYDDDTNTFEVESLEMFHIYNQEVLSDILSKCSGRFFMRILKYIRMLSQQLVHIGVRRRKKTSYDVITGGSHNSITVVAHSVPIKNERSEMKIFNAYIISNEYHMILKNLKGCFTKFMSYQLSNGNYLIISNWYTITAKTISLYSESLSKVMSCIVYLCLNTTPLHYNRRIRSATPMLMLVSVCKTKETVNFLALLRYISIGHLSEYNCIGDLLLEKVDRRVCSLFCGTIIKLYLDELVKSKPDIAWKKDLNLLSNKNEDSFTFSAYLPLLRFDTNQIQDFLSEVYLVNMCSDDLMLSNHSFDKFVSTLKEYEDKLVNEPDYFEFNEELMKFVSNDIVDNVKSISNFDIDNVKIADSRLINHASSNGVLSESNYRAIKLYDRIIKELSYKKSELTVLEASKHILIEPFKFTMVEKLQRQDPREIFKSDLKGICCLKMIETYSGYLNSKLFSECISLGGDQKYFRIQNETHKIVQEQKEQIDSVNSEKKLIISRTSDSSKWSTGDNCRTLLASFDGILNELKHSNHDIYLVCKKGLEKMENRELVLEDIMFDRENVKGSSKLRQAFHLRNSVKKIFNQDKNVNLKAGWPQGFFNKLSSLKHYICGTIAICLYKLNRYKQDPDRLLETIIDQGFHSDDYTYIGEFETKEDLILWEKCLNTARRLCCIRENIKKSCADSNVREFLSFFVIMGSVFIPHIKFIINMYKDIPGTCYTEDLYSSISRVRECYRIGVSEIWCQFAIKLVQTRISRMYSMYPGMNNYNSEVNNYNKPCEFGGYFYSHPLVLLFFGVKANNVRIFSKHGPEDLAKIIPGIYVFDEDNEEISNDYRELECFFQYPRFDLKYGSDVVNLRKRLKLHKLDKEIPYHQRLLFKYVDYKSAENIMFNRLFERAGRRMYSKIPKGLIETVIHRSVLSTVYKSGDKNYNLVQLYKHINKTHLVINEDIYAIIDMALFAGSPLLYAVFGLFQSRPELLSDTVQQNKNISYLAHINLKNPGNREILHISECLALLCNELSDEIKDEIKRNLINWEDDVLSLKNLLLENFDKEQIETIKELDLMLKFFNTRYPSNKFLMVPDARLRNGIDNINIFLKDMLQYRAGPNIYRDIDWEPIGRMRGWKNQTIFTEALIESASGSRNMDFIYESYNAIFTITNMFDFSMAKSKDALDNFFNKGKYLSKSLYDHFKSTELYMIQNKMYKARSTRIFYLIMKAVYPESLICEHYEKFDFKIGYGVLSHNRMTLTVGLTTALVDLELMNAKLFLSEKDVTSSAVKLIYLIQQLFEVLKTGKYYPAYLVNLLGKRCIYVEENIDSVETRIYLTYEGMKHGLQIKGRCLRVSNVEVEYGKHFRVPSSSSSTYSKFMKLFNSEEEKIESGIFDDGFQVRDGSRSNLYYFPLQSFYYKRLDLSECDYVIKNMSISELYSCNLLRSDMAVQITSDQTMLDSGTKGRDDLMYNQISKSRLNQVEYESLHNVFKIFNTNFGYDVRYFNEAKNTIETMEVDQEFNDMTWKDDDMEFVSMDIFDISEKILLSKKRKRPKWFEFERLCYPKVKMKLNMHRDDGLKSVKGISMHIYSWMEECFRNANIGTDSHSKSFWEHWSIMIAIILRKHARLDRGRTTFDQLVETLITYGGISRRSKFWSDLFAALNVKSLSEYA